MRFRTMCLVVPVAYLIGVGSWQLFKSALATRDASLALATPSVALASDGVAKADATGVLRVAASEGLVNMHVTTPMQVREVLAITRAATTDDLSLLVDAALHAEDPLVAGNAVLALGRLGEFSSEEALLALVSDPRQRVRQDAVKACGLDVSDAALPYLEQALGTAGDALRPLVLEALGLIGGSKARSLVQLFMDPNSATKTERVFARAALERMEG